MGEGWQRYEGWLAYIWRRAGKDMKDGWQRYGEGLAYIRGDI